MSMIIIIIMMNHHERPRAAYDWHMTGCKCAIHLHCFTQFNDVCSLYYPDMQTCLTGQGEPSLCSTVSLYLSFCPSPSCGKEKGSGGGGE